MQIRRIIIPVLVVRSMRAAIRDYVRAAIKFRLERRAEQELARVMARMHDRPRKDAFAFMAQAERQAEHATDCAGRQAGELIAAIQKRVTEG